MNIQQHYLEFRQAECKDCYRCIRNCPVKAINFSSGQASILAEECLLCGQCFVACPQNAKEIRNDLGAAKALIASGAPVYASLAPSFTAAYDGLDLAAMTKALLRLGFHSVEETAVGAELVTQAYEKLMAEGRQKVIISSCCHSVTLLLQKHYPKALPFLAPVVSPMQAHSMLIKRDQPEARSIFIGPCISKKAEAEQFGQVDCVLTFDELTAWLREEGVELEKGSSPSPNPDADAGGKSRLYPTTGGILRTLSAPHPKYTCLCVDGMENCIRAVQEVLRGGLDNCFIEMSACAGSCAAGPVMEKARRAPLRSFLTIEQYAGSASFSPVPLEAQSMKKSFTARPLPKINVPDSALEEVLAKIGKTRPEHELNCGSCGYDSCREKAMAVLMGKAELTMCLPFLKAKAESFSDIIITSSPNGIVVLNENLEIQQINKAACRILNLNAAGDVLNNHVVSVLDPEICYEVMESGVPVYERGVFLAEYNRYVQQTVIYDKNYHIITLMMRDVTEEENARAMRNSVSRQTAEVTDQVIDKQMRVVQEIASLLGETAAETKIALTKLKESLNLE